MSLTHLNFGSQFVQRFLRNFLVSLGHVSRLLGIEGVCYAPQNKHIQLNPLLPLLLLLLVFLLQDKVLTEVLM